MFRLNLRRLFISAPKTLRRSTQSNYGFIVMSNCLYGLLPSTVNFIWRYNNSYKNYKSKFSKWFIFTSSIAFTLLSAQPNLDEKRLFRAAQYGTIQDIKRLCRKSGKVKPDVRHPLGWTPLMVAAANGHTDVVKALLDCGASVNLQDQYHNPQITGNKIGMHMLDVMLKREEEFCEALTAKASFLGFTALHYAALADSSDVVSVLLRHEADPLIRDHAGRRPLDYVREDSPLKNVLLQYTEQMEKIEKGKLAEERRRFPLEQRLRQYIVGQHSAINTVAAAIRRKENGWADDEHPLVFLFLGSSGIGKTELAKQLAHYIHKEHTQAFIRLDMSEYQEKHEVAKLIGAPPGYIGHDDGGQLTKHLAKQPDAVVLFDEVDKAHPDVLTVLLQLFDEGRITDGKGKLIECKNAIFVMTSNLASDEIASHGLQLREEAVHVNKTKMQDTYDTKDENLLLEVSRHFKDTVVRPILKRHFGRDEFLGRINEIVYFLPFSRQELITLVSMELTAWASKAIKRHSIELKWENGVLGTLADGYDIHYGARSIKHEVERRVINKIALAAERGILATDSSIMIAIDGEGKINIMMKKKNEKKYIPIG